MQLKPNLRQALALASCALVHGQLHAAEGDWKSSGSLLYYSETDRVTAVEPALFFTQDRGDESTFTFRAVYDSLSGASPNGAAMSTAAQTFTAASGASYTTPANRLPLKSFSDERIAIGIDSAERTSPTSGRTLTGNLSSESDYFSLGASGNWTEDFNSKLTTLAIAVGGSIDAVNPSGGVPVGLQRISVPKPVESDDDDNDKARGDTVTGASGGGDGESEGGFCEGCEYKTTIDLMVGVTQVLSRRTLMQVNYSLSSITGYLTDPYKIVSVVDPTTGEPVSGLDQDGTTVVTDYVYEKRPSQRLANSLFVKLVHSFGQDVVHLSYRYFVDDWGIRANTAELHYRWRLTDGVYLEPQFRYHRQSAADFFHYSITGTHVADGGNQTGLDYASADLRLAAMTATTTGLKLGVAVGGGELTLRVATMVETGDSHPSSAWGVQKGLDLHPKLEATIANIGYSIPF